jgi:hypothetical protein
MRGDDADPEQQLALLTRHYWEASARFRRTRDEYHALTMQPGVCASLVAAALGRYTAMRQAVEALQSRIGALGCRPY